MKQELLIEKPNSTDVARFLLVRFKCPYCREFQKAIKLINLRLPVNRRIKIVDCMHWENYRVKLEPIMDKFSSKLFSGYPLCFITKEGIEQGIILEPSDADMLKTYLNKFLEEEFIY